LDACDQLFIDRKELKMKIHALTVAALAALASHAVLADPEADFWQQPKIYGEPAPPATPDHTVRLRPNSHWVNVRYGEIVRFVAQGVNGTERSFDWWFDVSPEVTSFDLSKVAPADFPNRNVRVLIDPSSPDDGG
jgi:Heavy-metal resistance protein CzcE